MEASSPAAAPPTPERIDTLAVRIERMQVDPGQPAASSSAPATPGDQHRSSRGLWPSPVTPLQGCDAAPAANGAAERAASTPAASTAVEQSDAKRLRSSGADEAQQPVPMQCSPVGPSRHDSHASQQPAAPRDNGANEEHAAGPAGSQAWRKYLCYFLHRLLDFRAPELESLASWAGIPMRLVPPELRPDINAFWTCHLPSDQAARRLAERSILVKGFFEVYAEGDTMDQLAEAVRALPAATLAPFRHASWKIVVDAWGSVYSAETGVQLIERLDCLPLDGRVQMTDPDVKFWLIVVDTSKAMQSLPQMPLRYYFCREVATNGTRNALRQYALRARRYLGPTSMDAEMAFLMCNQARVRRGMLVYDPFVGTGSILVAAAHHGAMTLGADIDPRVISLGKVDKTGQPVNTWTNFADYGLQAPVGLIRCDAHTPPFRRDLEEVYDAVVTDPPYGVRAGGRKSVPKPDIHIGDVDSHYPQTDPYPLGECLRDLLDAAAKSLRTGGRLVYFLPVAVDMWDAESDVPTHPALRVLADSEQYLTSRYSRRLITMEKVRPYDAAAAAAHHAASGPPLMAIDTVHDVVFEVRECEEAVPRPVSRKANRQWKPEKRRYRSKVI